MCDGHIHERTFNAFTFAVVVETQGKKKSEARSDCCFLFPDISVIVYPVNVGFSTTDSMFPSSLALVSN